VQRGEPTLGEAEERERGVVKAESLELAVDQAMYGGDGRRQRRLDRAGHGAEYRLQPHRRRIDTRGRAGRRRPSHEFRGPAPPPREVHLRPGAPEGVDLLVRQPVDDGVRRVGTEPDGVRDARGEARFEALQIRRVRAGAVEEHDQSACDTVGLASEVFEARRLMADRLLDWGHGASS